MQEKDVLGLNGGLAYLIKRVDQELKKEPANEPDALALADKTKHIYERSGSYTDVLKMQNVNFETRQFMSFNDLIKNISYNDSIFAIVLLRNSRRIWTSSIALYSHDADKEYILLDSISQKPITCPTLDFDVRNVLEKKIASSFLLLMFSAFIPVPVKIEQEKNDKKSDFEITKKNDAEPEQKKKKEEEKEEEPVQVKRKGRPTKKQQQQEEKKKSEEVSEKKRSLEEEEKTPVAVIKMKLQQQQQPAKKKQAIDETETAVSAAVTEK